MDAPQAISMIVKGTKPHISSTGGGSLLGVSLKDVKRTEVPRDPNSTQNEDIAGHVISGWSGIHLRCAGRRTAVLVDVAMVRTVLAFGIPPTWTRLSVRRAVGLL